MGIEELQGGEISGVAPSSIGGDLGIKVGDRLVSINGHPVRDILDYQFYSAEPVSALEIKREREVLKLHCEASGDLLLGLEFAEVTFDELKRCHNHCFFCFIAGMPKGMRRGLYIRDDDFRHSFLFGNFITLTNLTENDWQRLAEQRLSPIYVSVHATDPALRRRMLGNPSAPDILAQLRRLAQLRVEVHAQVVLCPTINDGLHLRRTIEDLLDLYPAIKSIGIVPVGVTRHNCGGRALPNPHVQNREAKIKPDATLAGSLRPFETEETQTVVELVSEFQAQNRRMKGKCIVHLADEFYLRLDLPLPPAGNYDGFPQFFNGIGMARSFVNEWQSALRKKAPGGALAIMKKGSLKLTGKDRKPKSAKPNSSPRGKVALVTGALFAPTLRSLVIASEGHLATGISVVAVQNDFFGTSITVAGLLTGQDLIAQLPDQGYDLVILPRTMLDAEGKQTLDGFSVGDLERRLSTNIAFAQSPKEIFSLLTAVA